MRHTKRRARSWRAAGPALRPFPVLAEDFALLVLKRRVRVRRGHVRMLH